MIEKVEIGNATLYLGDCREILPMLPKMDAIITDPVWPNASPIHPVPGSERPWELFAETAPLFNAERVIVQLGCDSDPTFLRPLAARFPFLRTCWLEYACPSYKGRLLHTGDVAYAYGAWPPARAGAMVIPGKSVSTKRAAEFIRGRRPAGKEKGGYEALAHPMPRRLQHVIWLVNWFSVPHLQVLDPFMGSGTTGEACVKTGRHFIGIEIKREFFDYACERIDQVQKQERLFTETDKVVKEQMRML